MSVRLDVEAKLSMPLLFNSRWHIVVKFGVQAALSSSTSGDGNHAYEHGVPSSRRLPWVTLEPLVPCLGTKFSFVWFKFKLVPG